MNQIAFLSYDMSIGGAERMITVLIRQFIREGFPVDLVLVKKNGTFLQDIDPQARVISLNQEHIRNSISGLTKYLSEEKPSVVISSLTHINLAAVIARKRAKSNTKLILIEHNTISRNNLAQGIKEKILTLLAHHYYPKADRIVVVSKGSARDLEDTLRIPSAQIIPIYNPLDLAEINRKKEETPDHQWLQNKDKPVLLAVGRLTKAKNFSFLLDVFAEVVKNFDCKLIILGDGEERGNLEKQIRQLNLENSVDMPGFKSNPYPYLANADILLCSSEYEGFNLTIAESLACGTPVISVDCPHGPAEILVNGKYGKLTPVGDLQAMENAILETLADPPDGERKKELRSRANDFSAENIFSQYYNLIQSIN